MALLPVVAAAALGFAITIAAFYPGYMSPDSIAQLTQGRRGEYSDWHPPAMAWLWGRIDRILPGPAGLLALHNLLFWGSLATLASVRFPTRRWAAAAVVLAVGFFPPLFALVGTIWKDVALGVTLLAATTLLLVADRRRSLLWIGPALPLLLYAVCLRHNAVPAVIPFVLWASWIAIRDQRPPVIRERLAIALGAIVLLISLIAARAEIDWALAWEKTRPVQQLYVHDLTAISIAADENRLPLFVQQGAPLTVAELQRIYTPDTVVHLLCCDALVRRLNVVYDRRQVAALGADWRQAVLDYPGAYLLHRWSALRQLLGWRRDLVCLPFHVGVDANALGVMFHPSVLNAMAMRVLEAMRNSLLFRGWAYLLLALLGTGWALATWHRHRTAAFLAVVTSSLLYFVTYFFVATACDFRLLWWSVVAVVIAPLLVGIPARRSVQFQ